MNKVHKLVITALIAAIYAAVTILLAPISYGMVQVRVSEALTILPYFSPYSIVGLFLGCVISNLYSPIGPLDIIVGSLATLISAIITCFIGKIKIKFARYIAPLPAVIINGIFIGALISNVFSNGNFTSFFSSALWVGIGEALACYVLGLPLLIFIDKKENIKKIIQMK